MVSSGMLRRVDLVRTDVSEEPSASLIRVTRIGELGTRVSVASYGYVPSSPILVTLMIISSLHASVASYGYVLVHRLLSP
jgi:hypothetical protein